MASAFDQGLDSSKKGKIIKTAYDSETFDANASIKVDGLVGSATISPSGRDVALASPEGLAIIDLDSPYSAPRRLSSHGMPWLVVDVQWSPFGARDSWVASTANHRCLVWNLSLRDDSSTGAIEHSLQGHSRAITDINFSAHHPDILATCAVDGYVHCWDLRKPQQPVLTFCDWDSGATQVKYNRQDPHILASSHDRYLHIWDERKPSIPLKSIAAHTSKIYGLDWNRTCSTGIVTCSLDKTIKIWDYAASDEPQNIIRTDFPVWRARHTPFGSGLLAMSQSEPGNLYLYDMGSKNSENPSLTETPLAVFSGHGNHKAKEFLWRSRGVITDDGIDNREFQLVSWGEDSRLCLQPVEPAVLNSVGHVIGGPAPKNLKITRKGATYKTFRAVEDHASGEHSGAKMKDHRRRGEGTQYNRSAITMGMRTMPPQYPRASSTSWRGPAMKAKPSTWKNRTRPRDQLGWMKGITMSRKKSPVVTSPRRKNSKDSGIFSPNFHDHWGEPETIQEEVIRVHHQLPNVKWKLVDMDKLTFHTELRGPWGADGVTIYMEVKIDIPASYPKSRPAKFLVEKTALMTPETYRKLNQNVSTLASQFSKRKQNCLEVIFSYLLGETDLSNSETFFKNVKDLDDAGIDALDESSSDDEDQIPAGSSVALSGELTASTELDPALGPAHRATMPPLPVLCGARFSNTGKLVCFFPTKEERSRVLPFNSTDSNKERPKGEPNFAAFGRLPQDSTQPRRRFTNDDASSGDEQSDTDDSEDSSSSSDSDTTYMHRTSMWYPLPGRSFRQAFSGTQSIHSSGGGTGIGTGTGTGTSRRRLGKPKNILSIHNVAADLPAQRELAQDYVIFGDGATICEHNAKVAQKNGRSDLVDVWKYAALLLRKDIPLELLKQDHQPDESVLVIATSAVEQFRREAAEGTFKSNEVDRLMGRVKWGHHPLAKDLINGLFEHFERMADVQMLAMLSCIFGGSSTDEGVAYAESHLTQPETPLPMKAPSYSLDYFPADAHLWYTRHKSQANSGISTPKTAHTPIHVVGSYGSDLGLWGGDPASTSYSCGETPPSRTPKDHLSEGDPTHSLSTSPNNQLLRRANTALSSASGFAANFPRPFASVASSSPPDRKRPSPHETLLSNLAPSNITWGGSTILGPVSSEPPITTRNSYAEEEPLHEEVNTLGFVEISTEMEDQAIFDDDGWLSVPLLEQSREVLYSKYRYAYAEMLLMWGQPLARLEIMKFNVIQQDWSASSEAVFHDARENTDNASVEESRQGADSPIPLGKKDQLQVVVTSDRGLDVSGLCRVHEIPLEPRNSNHSGDLVGGAVGTCERCSRKRVQSNLICVYCHEPVIAFYPPCLACGCASHEACLAEWFGSGETECPAGDECNCIEQANEGLVETRAAMMGVMETNLKKLNAQLGSIEELNDDQSHTRLGRHHRGDSSPLADKGGDWETVASGASLPLADSQGKPLGGALYSPGSSSQEPLSAAKISLGNRLKKSTGQWSSSPTLRRGRSSSTGGSGLGRRS